MLTEKWATNLKSAWMPEPGTKSGELQTYVDSPDNLYVENGNLVLKAKKDSSGNWTAPRLRSRFYIPLRGTLTVRALVPFEQGIWPAFWALGSEVWDQDAGQKRPWAQCGELDIFEVPGQKYEGGLPMVHGSFKGANEDGSKWDWNKAEGLSSLTSWTTFGLVMQPDRFEWQINGSTRAVWGRANMSSPKTWPFRPEDKIGLVTNIAVGAPGGWAGTPNPSLTEATMRLGEIRWTP